MSTKLQISPRDTRPTLRGAGCFGALTSVIAVVAVVALVVALTRPALFGMGEEKVESTTIGAQLSDIAELATEEYAFSDVGKFDQAGLEVLGVHVPFTGRNFLVTYDGRVTAGIRDASLIDVTSGNHTIEITLPKAEVLESHIDADSVKVYDQTMNPINQLRVEDVTGFIADRENDAREKAVSAGLLDRAGQRAEELARAHVEALVAGTDMEDYQVRVTLVE
ncbi:DUF4230 domain-containing protein [Corynebacterium fournieri]|uniref:DUF4230 domain-containing protein n=1 Tax=Corynebacterium fournieri TaxID=1852390 RepID=UPI001E4FE043|nr:DUF4230 domain-containing protein [Corynebacterium fournieri]WJY98010.1 hypothetical protein CFOUR_08025 [Corynebacterium fournieri]